jgi:hypothetical protein
VVFEDRGELAENRDALTFGLHCFELLLEERVQTLPVHRLLVDDLETAHRDDVGGIAFERIAIQLARAFEVVELADVQARELHPSRVQLRRVCTRLDLPLQHLDHFAGLAALVVDDLECVDRRLEGRVDVERALVIDDRLIDVLLVALEELADLDRDLLATWRMTRTLCGSSFWTCWKYGIAHSGLPMSSPYHFARRNMRLIFLGVSDWMPGSFSHAFAVCTRSPQRWVDCVRRSRSLTVASSSKSSENALTNTSKACALSSSFSSRTLAILR